jgi:hypothetical protein
LYTHVVDSIVLIPFLDLLVHALVLFFYYCLIFTYAFVSCSIAWFPSIVLVGFPSSWGPPPYNTLINIRTLSNRDLIAFFEGTIKKFHITIKTVNVIIQKAHLITIEHGALQAKLLEDYKRKSKLRRSI